jgi:hypothetical protein
VVAHAVAVEPVLGIPNSLIAICREFRSKSRWKDPQDRRLRQKFPMQRIREFFAADQGFLMHEQRIYWRRKVLGESSRDRTPISIDQGLRLPGHLHTPQLCKRQTYV